MGQCDPAHPKANQELETEVLTFIAPGHAKADRGIFMCEVNGLLLSGQHTEGINFRA